MKLNATGGCALACMWLMGLGLLILVCTLAKVINHTLQP